MSQLYFQDIDVGMTRDSGDVTVGRDEMVEFARKYDPQPMHVDESAASESTFGALVASGWFTVALTSRLLVDGFISDIANVGGKGTDELRWPNPVYAGDTLSASLEVVGAKTPEANASYGLVETAFETTNQDDETVLSMIGLLYVKRRSE